jgi:DNA-binding IclR family transcriptional regulator
MAPVAATGSREDAPSVQTLDRGLRLLHLLAAAPDGLTVSELAVRLDVHRAIVYRLLSTLAAHRLVMRGQDGRHRLWTGLVELARAVIPRWRAVAEPELTAMADELGATAILTVASEDCGVALLVQEPRHTQIHVAYRPGLRHPLHRGASGKAILAGRPPQPGEPPDVAEARRRGYAVSEGEIQPGAIGVAAPIVVDGWAEASVGVVTLGELPPGGQARVLRAAAAIGAAFPATALPDQPDAG